MVNTGMVACIRYAWWWKMRKILHFVGFFVGLLILRNQATAANEHYGTFTILDYSEEKSPTRFSFGGVTALNIAGFLTQFGNLRTAVQGIIKGVIQKEKWVGDDNVLSNVPPSDDTAQVELKWLVSYEGQTTKKKYRYEIATPDTSKLIPGTDQADLTDSDIAAYITAVETLAKTPDDDTEGINVLGIRLVGRNN